MRYNVLEYLWAPEEKRELKLGLPANFFKDRLLRLQRQWGRLGDVSHDYMILELLQILNAIRLNCLFPLVFHFPEGVFRSTMYLWR